MVRDFCSYERHGLLFIPQVHCDIPYRWKLQKFPSKRKEESLVKSNSIFSYYVSNFSPLPMSIIGNNRKKWIFHKITLLVVMLLKTHKQQPWQTKGTTSCGLSSVWQPWPLVEGVFIGLFKIHKGWQFQRLRAAGALPNVCFTIFWVRFWFALHPIRLMMLQFQVALKKVIVC